MMISALTINRSEYVWGRPRPRFDGSAGMGILSISLMKLTSSGSRGTIQLLPSFWSWQLKYYGGDRALASPLRGFFLPVRIYDHVSISFYQQKWSALKHEEGFAAETLTYYYMVET